MLSFPFVYSEQSRQTPYEKVIVADHPFIHCLFFFKSRKNALKKFIQENKENSSEEIMFVSIKELIDHPDKYDEKIVKTRGFLNLDFEGTTIYVRGLIMKSIIIKILFEFLFLEEIVVC